MTELRTIAAVIQDQVSTLRKLLIALRERSALEKRFGSMGGLVVISPTPYRWKPLDQEGIQLQTQARRIYRKICELMRALLSDQPAAILDHFRAMEAVVNGFVDQESATSDDDVRRLFAACLASLDYQVELLARLRSGGEESQLVPDTNALIFNPDLERWRFSECSRFTLVFTPVVLEELDALKVDSRRGDDVRKKAERLIRQFGEYRRRGKVTEGVPLMKQVSTVRAIAVEPDFGTSLPWLKATNNDDRILAAAIEVMKANPYAPVAVITRDMNLQNKAELAEVPVLGPPDPEEHVRIREKGDERE